MGTSLPVSSTSATNSLWTSLRICKRMNFDIKSESDVESIFQWLVGVNAFLCKKPCIAYEVVLSENSIYSAIGTLQWNSGNRKIQACTLLRSLILNHGFKDGNKRTAVVACNAIWPCTCSDSVCLQCVVDIACGSLKDISKICSILYGTGQTL